MNDKKLKSEFNYPDRYPKKEAIGDISALALDTSVSTAGRLGSIRAMGKLMFVHLQDYSGAVQLVLKDDVLTNTTISDLKNSLRSGDFVGVTGKTHKTKTGEYSILVDTITVLGGAHRTLPEKWAGLSNQEVRYRQRYLDLIANPKTRARFIFRSKLIQNIREFYWQENFLEVETPSLMHRATGAVANPYKTHNDALGENLFLRISHELPLKTLIVGGFDKIFELGKAFRNEGIDGSHLPEHTHLEHYAAYWNYEDNIAFTEKMFSFLLKQLGLPKKITMEDGSKIDLSFPWPRLNFSDLLKEKTGIDVLNQTSAKKLLQEIVNKGYNFEGMDTMSVSGLVDNLYKKVVRPTLINPTFLVQYPAELQPLARRNNDDPSQVDQFQLIINGWEIVKAYSELVDPVEQKERFKEQLSKRKKGEDETMEVDEDYITAMEYGMPPISGWGMGIDRLTALLTGQTNLREVVFFPLLRDD